MARSSIQGHRLPVPSRRWIIARWIVAPWIIAPWIVAWILGGASVTSAAAPPSSPPSLLLITLDTTRADALGCYGGQAATPHIDALAARGLRYLRAVSPAPLTLPSHATLLSGLDPPEHGVRYNGNAVLPSEVPTLATVLAARGYETAAVVGSRVLDRRFGLARGFDVYDDEMSAERVGEYGYPERDAAAVTDAALSWLAGRDSKKPFFLWVHYYDPHAPYQPPAPFRGRSEGANYAGEVAYVDAQVGRLMEGLPSGGKGVLTALVGDHGEALGEHGERTHGIFLYRSVIEVPLVLAGPAVPAGKVVEPTVAIRALPPTLTSLLGLGTAGLGRKGVLAGFPESLGELDRDQAYSEARMPASAYGWSSLKALTSGRWRFIVAPRPELYDLEADPGESRNLVDEERRQAVALKRALAAYEASFESRRAGRPEADPELAAALRSLGYLSGASGDREGTLDPKDGIALLARFEDAKRKLAAGQLRDGLAELAALVEKNPENVPFLGRYAGALLAAGQGEKAIATYRRAVELNPRLDFLHLNLASAYQALGRLEEARAELELTLELNPRLAGAWLSLAEIAHRSGKAGEERRLLQKAVEAGTQSAALLIRLGQIELAAGEGSRAEEHLRQATELAPGWPLAWLMAAEVAEKREQREVAAARLRQALSLSPRDAGLHLRLGRLLRTGPEARKHLEAAVALGPGTSTAREAAALLSRLP